jgi:hypothetical protein
MAEGFRRLPLPYLHCTYPLSMIESIDIEWLGHLRRTLEYSYPPTPLICSAQTELRAGAEYESMSAQNTLVCYANTPKSRQWLHVVT